MNSANAFASRSFSRGGERAEQFHVVTDHDMLVMRVVDDVQLVSHAK